MPSVSKNASSQVECGEHRAASLISSGHLSSLFCKRRTEGDISSKISQVGELYAPSGNSSPFFGNIKIQEVAAEEEQYESGHSKAPLQSPHSIIRRCGLINSAK